MIIIAYHTIIIAYQFPDGTYQCEHFFRQILRAT